MTIGERSPLKPWRSALWLTTAIVVVLGFALQGIHPLTVALIAALIAFGFAVQYVENRTRRPLRSYLRVGLASAVLALALIGMPLVMGAGLWIGLILWAGLSGAAFAWIVHYERTEPL